MFSAFLMMFVHLSCECTSKFFFSAQECIVTKNAQMQRFKNLKDSL